MDINTVTAWVMLAVIAITPFLVVTVERRRYDREVARDDAVARRAAGIS